MNISELISGVERTWVDLPNAILNGEDKEVLERLRNVTQFDFTIRRMSTTRIGLLIKLAVSLLEPDECYLNIGVWQGYSFFSGITGNPEKLCVGNDNFSIYKGCVGFSDQLGALGRDFGDPKSIFSSEYARIRSKRTAFFECDCWELLRDWGQRVGFPIGFYFYDGDIIAMLPN